MTQTNSQQSILSLEEIKEQFFAGKSSLEKDEIAPLLKSLQIQVNSIIEKGDDRKTDLLEEIFSSAFSSDLADDLMEDFDPELYFKLGEWLRSDSNKRIKVIHEYLNLFRLPALLRKIYDDEKWEQLILDLILISNYNVDLLINQRTRDYKNKTLFNVLKRDTTSVNWQQAVNLIEQYSLSLLSLIENKNTKVAFLLENSLEMALLDLACLSSGIVNVMIPANSVSDHIEFILNQTKAEFVLIQDEKQLLKIKSLKKNLPHLKKGVLLKGSSAEDWIITSDELKSLSNKIEKNVLKERKENIKQDETATIMYTSGTTGEPKGIIFTQTNIIYKRFCRAMAIPEIGPSDRFLSFLPLYHTFGRYLEMMGSAFWAAEYSFMENPAVETMIENMQRIKPTVFISIPKKWMQLYEHISEKVNIEHDSEEKIEEAVKEVTGGSLRWGISAAGYLSPDIFRFFQKYGIELMSGFGMTEATGGITLTPPSMYKENSLGKALPGIQIKLGDDGEILIKGAYVMKGYFSEDPSETFTKEGWLPTGDIMKMDKGGFIEIVDRKKEIYKNVKGETIAPQKIENFFRDFDNVKQVFLVGDHRPFNTVLIFPNTGEDSPVNKMDEDEKQAYFSTVIVTVNNFLAPFERIVDFRLTDRPFNEENGELTPKGTYKRRVIEKNFNELISTMYEKDHTGLHIGDHKIKVPNWFLREKGVLSRDISAGDNFISIPDLNLKLAIEFLPDEKIRLGSFVYQSEKNRIDLQEFITTPALWIGNKELIDFTGNAIFQWVRRSEISEVYIFDRVFSKPVNVNSDLTSQLTKIISSDEISLTGLNIAYLLLQTEDSVKSDLANELIKKILSDETNYLYKLTLELASRPGITSDIRAKRKLFKSALQKIKKDRFGILLKKYLLDNAKFIDEDITRFIPTISKGSDNLLEIEKKLDDEIENYSEENDITETALPSLFELIINYGNHHPVTYKRIRRYLLRYELYNPLDSIREISGGSRLRLRFGLREWLGDNQTIAVDMETGEEYEWNDVIIFEEDIPQEDKQKITSAIKENPVLREAIFLLSSGVLVRLNNILPGGIWISKQSEQDDRVNYRVTIQTRYQGAYDLSLVLIKTNENQVIEKEMQWLVIAGSEDAEDRIVPRFGGFWDEYNLWTEEFVTGETVSRFLQRESRSEDESHLQRLFYLWPFFVWNATSAYVKFWRITGYKIEIQNPSPKHVIVPTHDYQTGTIINSISGRVNTNSVLDFFTNLYNKFILNTEEQYPYLKNESIWNYILSGIIEAEGEENGLRLIELFKDQVKEKKKVEDNALVQIINEFLEVVNQNGFIPKQLFFAIKRFHRWFKLNEDASLSAQAQMLFELYETYRMFQLEEIYPFTRTRFFLETAFFDSDEKFKERLREITNLQHKQELNKDEAQALVSQLHNEFELSQKEEFFLARLSYPHLKPTDEAALLKVRGEGSDVANLVVQHRDNDGNPFYIRHPVNPKEISKLHQLFIETNLSVHFYPEHEYLVAVSERGFIIGGLFYNPVDEETVHMEKIVVSNRYRRKGISESLMKDLFNRLKSEHYKSVTTGFFRPEYFYRFGFRIERKYSGLFKELLPASEENGEFQEKIY